MSLQTRITNNAPLPVSDALTYSGWQWKFIRKLPPNKISFSPQRFKWPNIKLP